MGAWRATWYRPSSAPIIAQRVDGVWRLSSGVLASRFAETPEQAMVLLSRAVKDSDPALLLGLLPKAERVDWSEEGAASFLMEPSRRTALLALMKRLKPTASLQHHPLNARSAVIGDASGQVVLGREDDGWKIMDLRPHERFMVPPESTDEGE
jgi:hypothetical protein